MRGTYFFLAPSLFDTFCLLFEVGNRLRGTSYRIGWVHFLSFYQKPETLPLFAATVFCVIPRREGKRKACDWFTLSETVNDLSSTMASAGKVTILNFRSSVCNYLNYILFLSLGHSQWHTHSLSFFLHCEHAEVTISGILSSDDRNLSSDGRYYQMAITPEVLKIYQWL